MNKKVLSAKLLCIFLILFCIKNLSSQDYKTISDKANSVKQDTVAWDTKSFNNYSIIYSKTDNDNVITLKSFFDKGISVIEDFFGKPFSSKFLIYVYPERSIMDKQWQKDWEIPDFQSQCWMVASGVASRLDLLNPFIWDKQTCEHDSDNNIETQNLITHELVHVYQGQNNPDPNFDNMEDIRWFVEGLAVLVSCQLDNDRITHELISIKKGEYPKKLENMWSGENRYGYSGLMVKYISTTYAKEILNSLIIKTNEKEILDEKKSF